MRPVLIGDILCLARVILAAPQGQQRQLCADLLYQADCADKFRKRHGRAHPQWGDGSVMARATQYSETALTHVSLREAAFCRALETVLHELAVWREYKRQINSLRKSTCPPHHKEFSARLRAKEKSPLAF